MVAKKKIAKKKIAKKKKVVRKKNNQKLTKKNPKGAGNATKIIDWVKVDTMCRMQCTGKEIASVLGIHYDTLYKHCVDEKGIKFEDYLAEKREGGKASLRRKQWKLVEAGNATMCIWLGKQYLGQKDKNDFSSEDGSMANDGLSSTQRATLDKVNDEEY